VRETQCDETDNVGVCELGSSMGIGSLWAERGISVHKGVSHRSNRFCLVLAGGRERRSSGLWIAGG
jgi:hypothetical protein